jgi:hypothetical protein
MKSLTCLDIQNEAKTRHNSYIGAYQGGIIVSPLFPELWRPIIMPRFGLVLNAKNEGT